MKWDLTVVIKFTHNPLDVLQHGWLETHNIHTL